MKLYEPVTLAMPLAEEIGGFIRREGRLPNGNELREMLKSFGMEEVCLDRGLALYRSRLLIALAFPRGETLMVDVLPSSGELSDALEVIAYRDRTLGAFIVEILPTNDIEYEGNIGMEPIIIDEKTLEVKSNPILGYFEEDESGLFLVIDGETYERWKREGDINICPICGGELGWKGKRAYCRDCGYGMKVVRE